MAHEKVVPQASDFKKAWRLMEEDMDASTASSFTTADLNNLQNQLESIYHDLDGIRESVGRAGDILFGHMPEQNETCNPSEPSNILEEVHRLRRTVNEISRLCNRF